MSTKTSITFSMQMGNEFIFYPTTKMEVSAGISKAFGYVSDQVVSERPLMMDAVVEAHVLKYGSEFTPETCQEYLQIRGSQWLTKAFGKPAFYSGFAINGKYAYDETSEYKRSGFMGYSFTEATIHEGDAVEVYAFEDTNGMDYYLYFLRDGKRVSKLDVRAGDAVELKLEGLMFAYGGPMTDKDRKKHRLVSNVKEAQLVLVNINTGETEDVGGALTDNEGCVSLSFAEPGEYYVSSRGGRCRYDTKLANPWIAVTVQG